MSHSGEQGRALRLMVVDDHPMWRDAVGRDLDEAGFEVVATADGVQSATARAAKSSAASSTMKRSCAAACARPSGG